MNYIRFNEFGEIVKRDIRGIVATSDYADIIYIFYDNDINTAESSYQAYARVLRVDGYVVGPAILTLTSIAFDTEEDALLYGTPTYNEITEKYDVPCRTLTLTNEMLAVKGDLGISIIYNQILESGKKITDVNQQIAIKVFEAVEELYTEDEYNELLDLFLPKDLSGLVDTTNFGLTDKFLLRQSGSTKIISGANLILYATADIVSGVQKLKKISLDTVAPAETLNIGETRWNAEAGTDETRLSASVVRQNGRELVVKARNNTAHVIANGQPVYVSGASGSSPNWYIDKARSNNDSHVLKLIGMATEDILAGAFGYICIYGEVNGINTSAFEVNDVLYLGTTAGTITNVRPNELTNIVILGTCIRKHSSEGAILLRTQIIPKLANLSGVMFTDLAEGEVPIWNGTYWENYQIDSKFTDINAKNLEQDGRLDDVESGLIEIFQDAATKAELTTHNEDATAHLPIRQEIEVIRQDISRIEGRVKSYGEINYTQSELMALNESDRNTAIYNDILARFEDYTLENGDAVYTKASATDNDHEWEYNGTTWVDNGAYTLQKASNTLFGVVKGGNVYTNIVNGLIEVMLSDYATRVGDNTNSYTYTQLKNILDTYANELADRYTKSQTYSKTQVDALFDAFKSIYGWTNTDIGTYAVTDGGGGGVIPENVIDAYDLIIVNKLDTTNGSIVESKNFKVQTNKANYPSSGILVTFTPTTELLVYASGNYELFNDTGVLNTYNLIGIKMQEFDASNIDYNNTTSGLDAENVQEAIDELENEIDSVETNITNGTTDISFTDEDLTATNLADAISEVNDRVDATNLDLTNEINQVNASIEETNFKVRTNELKTTQLEESIRKVEAGDSKGTVSGTEVINLPLNTANGQLKPTINGMILQAKQLVVNGDFETGNLTGWTGGGAATKTIVSDIKHGNYALKLDYNNTSGLVYQVINANNGDYLYISLKTYLRSFTSNSIILGISDNSDYTNAANLLTHAGDVLNSWLKQSFIFQNANTNNPRLILGMLSNATKNIIYDDIVVVNVSKMKANKQYSPLYDSTFDLMTDGQITAQMDAWVNDKILPNNNLLSVNGNKKITSVGKNLWYQPMEHGSISITTGQNTPSTSAIRSIGYQRVKPSTVYVLTNINRWYLYDINYNFISTGTTASFTTTTDTFYIRGIWVETTNLSSTIQLELGSKATGYEPYKTTEMTINAPDLYSLPNGVKDTLDFVNGKLIDNQKIKVESVSGVVAVNTTNYPLAKNTGQFINYLTAGDSEIGVIGTDSTTGAGTLLYELATPIETEVPASGNLLGHSKGTVYIENVVADVDVYTTKIDITNNDLPIKTIEKIAILNENGTETLLNVNTAVINVDKLSFTHPNLTANDKVYFIYEYEDTNNVFGLTDIEYFNSNNVIIDSVTGKAYRIVNSVASGILTQSLVEVL